MRAAAVAHPKYEERPQEIMDAMLEAVKVESRGMKNKLMQPGMHWQRIPAARVEDV